MHSQNAFVPAAVKFVVVGNEVENGVTSDTEPACDQLAAILPASDLLDSACVGPSWPNPLVQSERFPEALQQGIAVWPVVESMLTLRRVQLNVRVQTHGAIGRVFWRAVAALPQLIDLEVIGLGGDSDLDMLEFLKMLTGHRVLQFLFLQSQQRELRGEGCVYQALMSLPALQVRL